MTTDANDAKEKDLHYVPQILSKMSVNTTEPTSAVCFVGANKGREGILLDCYHRLNKLVGKENLDFTIVDMKGTENGISTTPLKYNSVMDKEISSKCLLEIVTGKQTGMTLRSAAAIVYDKFLITNNKYILSSPWYNENVLYIEKAEDITEEFINRVMTTEARYNYQNEFSPINIINHIEKFYC